MSVYTKYQIVKEIVLPFNCFIFSSAVDILLYLMDSRKNMPFFKNQFLGHLYVSLWFQGFPITYPHTYTNCINYTLQYLEIASVAAACVFPGGAVGVYLVSRNQSCAIHLSSSLSSDTASPA